MTVSPLNQTHQVSPEALAEHLNVLMMQDPPQLVLMAELFYPETKIQRKQIDDLCMFAPLVELDREVRKRFERGLVLPGAGSTFQFTAMPMGGFDPVAVVEAGTRRARAVRDGGRSNAQIEYHFVEIDGRWWISGYTLEHAGAAGLVSALSAILKDAARLDSTQRGARHALAAIAEASRRELPRVRAQEYRSVEAARRAFQQRLGLEFDERGIKLLAVTAEQMN